MKLKEVPQDGKRMLKTTLVHYAENDEGKFEKVQSDGWDPGYYAGLNLQKEFTELAEEAKIKVKNGQSSTLEYFMYKAFLDPIGLAQFTGMPWRKVKKHLTPRGFEKLDDKTLARYAHVLHTDVETIKKFKSTL
ncbi:MAG TPA: hypothetical protein PLM53_09140 [Spirochaetota bacterium]|mgnify:CR=1 FL=1|nr:hypothetical protein [Spirochaetota bacterium]HPC40108.1 hypothetical protein [Spirochaetota bacterium]HPL15844.1 hypothetical protein [Spirochaetota bacterium]HQF08512.1 hypothetical protein [Spirochaetota bacterium]HQH97251.1 hypothetical protein [Spirochaetota bacterium]